MKKFQSMPSKKELLVTLWQLYSKQKGNEADAGAETFDKIQRMRTWFRAVLEGKADQKLLDELFPVAQNTYPKCSICGDEGWFFDEQARIPRHGPDGSWIVVRAPGMTICVCPKGTERQKNKKPKRATKEREAF